MCMRTGLTLRFCKRFETLALLCIARGHVVTMCPRALVVKGRRVTVRQFGPVVRLRPVPSFYALKCVWARLSQQGCVL
jgi:hypothetical protein